MSDIRLSICIATFNRAAFIGETLDGILAQLRPGVELLVVDGASSDSTEGVVTERFLRRGDCRYVRLPKNGGIDADYCRAVEQARGDYCWLMTDDDVPRPGAIDRILAELEHGPDLLIVNAEVAGPDLSSTLLDRKLPVAVDASFGPGEDSRLFSAAGSLLTFIGSVVVRTEVWRSRDPVPYLGSEFVHVGVIFQAPLARGARLVAEPLVRIRYGVAQWSPRAFEVWMMKWPRVVWGLPAVDEAAKGRVCSREPWRRSRDLLLMKAKGCFSIEEYRRWLAPVPMTWPTRLRVRAIAALPDRFYNALMRVLLPVLAPQARGTLLDLRRSRFGPRGGRTPVGLGANG